MGGCGTAETRRGATACSSASETERENGTRGEESKRIGAASVITTLFSSEMYFVTFRHLYTGVYKGQKA